MKNEDAVSPVVGVMLMLVVTIIIAAVVSAFASGMTESTENPPSITMDVSITNSGSWVGSHFEAAVLSVSEPIPTSDLKLVTSWSADEEKGGATVNPGIKNVEYQWKSGSYLNTSAPLGFGVGIDQNTGTGAYDTQAFGNYTLKSGVTMLAYPAGQAGGLTGGQIGQSGDGGYGVVTSGEYTYDGSFFTTDMTDSMQAVLGKDWEVLESGDVVTVKLIHTPSGQTIYEKDVVVG